MNTWTYLHRYNRYVGEGRALPLSCPDCKQEFTWLIGEDDEPVAWCVHEDIKFYPGELFWSNVYRVVVENTEDD